MILKQLNNEAQLIERELHFHKLNYKSARARTRYAFRSKASRPSTLAMSFSAGMAYGFLKDRRCEDENKKKSTMGSVLKLAGRLTLGHLVSDIMDGII